MASDTFSVHDTLISQFANSPSIVRMVENMDEYIRPDTDFDAFYNYVWNVQTAQAWGLDILGRIVNISRSIQIAATEDNFGFDEATDAQPFGQAPFHSGQVATSTYLLSDDAYRTLILMKALLNISNASAQSINQLLKNLFAGRGRCYVTDVGDMRIRFVFEFPLYDYEIAILTQSNAVPRPAAVLAQVMQVDISSTFGFAESGDSQPFNQGVFFNPSIGIINAI